MKVSRKYAVVLLLAMLPATRPLLAAGIGDFDYSYGNAGSVYNPLAVLPDGRLLYVSDDISIGNYSPYDFVLSTSDSTLFKRADIDGKPDLSYGVGGQQTPVGNFQYTYASLRAADGKLLIGGSLRMQQPALLRMGNDGNPDLTFGNGGFVAAPASEFLSVGSWVEALALQPDGRVLVLANDKPYFKDVPAVAALRRFNVDGTLDSGFAAQMIEAPLGQSSCVACSGPIAVLPGGAIRVGGLINPVYFSATGSRISPPVDSGALYPNTTNWKIVAPLPAGGSLISGTSNAAATTSGEKVDVGTDILLARLRIDGTPDGSFGNTGSGYAAFDIGQLALGRAGLFQYVRKISVSGDGRRVYLAVALSTKMESVDSLVADSGTAVVRLLIATDGRITLDSAFGRGGIVLLPPEVHAFIEDVVEQSGGAVVLTLSDGWTRWALRLSGSAHSSSGVIVVERYYTEARESDGELVLRVSRTGGSDGAVTITYKTALGSITQATPGVDFVAPSGQLDWGDGDTSDRFIKIQLINDSVAENKESISLAVTSPSGVNFNYAIGSSTVISAEILDDDVGSSTPVPPTTTGTSTPAMTGSDGGGGSFDVRELGLELLGILATRLLSQRRSRDIFQTQW